MRLIRALPPRQAATIKEVAKTEKLTLLAPWQGVGPSPEVDMQPTVFIGRDTRTSSPHLNALCIEGIKAMGAVAVDIGMVTTPQLHHVVYSHNRGEGKWASVDGYFDKLAEAYQLLANDGQPPDTIDKARKDRLAARGPLYIDCANGVGALQLEPLQAKLQGWLAMELFNTGPVEQLNAGCGAEHVQKKRLPPALPVGKHGMKRIASFDGDADRVVYFYLKDDSLASFELVDGDKIAVLAADFIGEQLQIAGITDVKLGIVQTAYANGGAHDYVLSRGIECPYAKTGVKFCHHVALQYDIGIYFEANGHGTAIFKDHVVEKLKHRAESIAAGKEGPTRAAYLALQRLIATAQLFNQAVGDSTADALFVEAVLAIRGWGIADWAAMYKEKPSRQTKVLVKDRLVVRPIPDETRLIDTDGDQSAQLQGKVDALAAKVPGGRAFCRPSGTEDVVRVYAEADSMEDADKLAGDVAIAIYETVDGVGDKPVSPCVG